MPLGRRSRKYNNTIICLAALVGIPPQHTNNRRHWWVEDRAPDKPSLSSPTSQASSQTQAKPTLRLDKPGLGFGKPGKPGLPRPTTGSSIVQAPSTTQPHHHISRMHTNQPASQPASRSPCPVFFLLMGAGTGSGRGAVLNRCSFGMGVGIGLGTGTGICQAKKRGVVPGVRVMYSGLTGLTGLQAIKPSQAQPCAKPSQVKPRARLGLFGLSGALVKEGHVFDVSPGRKFSHQGKESWRRAPCPLLSGRAHLLGERPAWGRETRAAGSSWGLSEPHVFHLTNQDLPTGQARQRRSEMARQDSSWQQQKCHAGPLPPRSCRSTLG